MTQLMNGAKHRNRQSFALTFLTFIATTALLSGCQKDNTLQSDEMPSQISYATASGSANPLSRYTNLSPVTRWELQQARAATAKYQNIANALADGYVDIDVAVSGMGHHYMNPSYVDGTFDYRKPEILVYDHNEDGAKELVAVEYAIPLNLSQNAPGGFSGTQDVWNGNTTFGLWLLHAWVWTYNPSGVFNPTNPNVHFHE